MKQKIIAIIPARGGSKGIPRKNIYPLANKPLIAYSIELALKSKYIDRVFVSTEDEEIAKIAKKYGAEIIDRPKELAMDDTPDLPVFRHAIITLREKEKYFPDIVINLRPTCPLRNLKDIDTSIEKMLESNCDSVRTITKARHHPYWMAKLQGDKILPFLENIDMKKYYQRQLLPDAYMINGGVDVMKADVIMNQDNLYGKDIRAIIMPSERSVDIDTKFDLIMAEEIINKGER